jgi:hypothetical protein
MKEKTSNNPHKTLTPYSLLTCNKIIGPPCQENSISSFMRFTTLETNRFISSYIMEEKKWIRNYGRKQVDQNHV